MSARPFRRGTFLRLDHGFLDDEAVRRLTPFGFALHVAGLWYASKHLTDGVLDKHPANVMMWAPHFLANGYDVADAAVELVEAGLWEDWPQHWLIVGFLKWNNSKAQVEQWRAAERERKADAAREKREETPTPADVQITDPPPGTSAESRTPSARNNVTAIADVRRSLNGGAA